jgi:hypothetical protein
MRRNESHSYRRARLASAPEPEDWWTIILGSGYRLTVEALSPENRERVRAASIAGVRDADIRQIRADVVYATARRPILE